MTIFSHIFNLELKPPKYVRSKFSMFSKKQGQRVKESYDKQKVRNYPAIFRWSPSNWCASCECSNESWIVCARVCACAHVQPWVLENKNNNNTSEIQNKNNKNKRLSESKSLRKLCCFRPKWLYSTWYAKRCILYMLRDPCDDGPGHLRWAIGKGIEYANASIFASRYGDNPIYLLFVFKFSLWCHICDSRNTTALTYIHRMCSRNGRWATVIDYRR